MEERTTRRTTPPAELLIRTVAAVITSFLLWHLVHFRYGVDHGIFATVADVMLRGGLPYRDAWDIKPPGIYLVFAATKLLLGHGIQPIRWVEAVCVVGTAAGLMILTWIYLRSRAAAVVSGALGAISYLCLDFWSTAQAEGFAGFLITWALVLSAPALGSDSQTRTRMVLWCCSGFMYGLAALLKPQFGLGVFISAILVMRRKTAKHETPRRLSISVPLIFGVGSVIPVFLCMLWLMTTGIWNHALEVITVWVPNYTRVTLEESGPYTVLVRPFVMLFFYLFDFMSVAMLLLLLFLPAITAREREGVLHVFGAMLFPMLGVGLQSKFFDYHFAGTVPLVAMLSGWGLWKVSLRVVQRYPMFSAETVLAALFIALLAAAAASTPTRWFVEKTVMRTKIMLGVPRDKEPLLDDLSRSTGFNYKHNRAAARLIRERTADDSPIYVWGIEAGLYDLSRRIPSSRYILNVAQRAPWSRDAARKELMQELADKPPACIVVQNEDFMKDLIDSDEDSFQSLGGFPELSRLITESYPEVESVGVFNLHFPRRPH